MADLSTISASDPADAEAVSAGASRIRALCAAVQTSFGLGNGTGTQAAEHYLKGFHKFPNGDGTYPFAVTAGNLGRLFLDTTNGRTLYDNGVSWQLMRQVAGKVDTVAGPVSGGSSSVYGTIGSTTINIASGCTVLLLTSADFTCTVNTTLQNRVFMDATTSIFPLESPVGLLTAGVVTRSMGMWVITSLAATTGNHTFALQLRGNTATAPTATGIVMASMQI